MLEDWKEIHRESGKGSQRAGSITSTGQLMKTSVLGKGRKQNKDKQNVFSGRHSRRYGTSKRHKSLSCLLPILLRQLVTVLPVEPKLGIPEG